MKSRDFSLSNLSRRERQIMEIAYARSEVTAQEVQDALESPPSYSAVRAALSLLEKKGLLKHARVGARYVFQPTIPATNAKVSVLKRIMETFFDNSAGSVVATLLGSDELKISRAELDRLERMIQEAKKKK